MSTEKNNKIKEFWKKNEHKIVLFLGIMLISTISFQLGILQGQKWQQEPLIIEKVPDNSPFPIKGVLGQSSDKTMEEEVESKDVLIKTNQKGGCLFIGSKKSDKYHKSDCRWADQIKSDNLVCFKSLDEAKNKGYVPASCMR